MTYRLLTINPGSTSTKIGIFSNDTREQTEAIHHSAGEINRYARISDQLDMRKQVILDTLDKLGIPLDALSAVVARGGLLKPIPGGTYIVNEAMVNDLKAEQRGSHASNLGGMIAYELAKELKIPAYIVDPVVVDEMQAVARYSGMPDLWRKSQFHALNQKAVAKKLAEELNRPYDQLNLIVAHMGGGISVGAHQQGQVVDVNNALDGDGPFSPERSGGVPIGDLMGMCFSGNWTEKDMRRKIVGGGGLVAYLGTNDARQVEERIAQGDDRAKEVYQALAYQVAKEIGACAAVLAGQVDAVIITGGLAHSELLTGWIREQVKFIAPVKIVPGENELIALAQGALRVLSGKEEAKIYV